MRGKTEREGGGRGLEEKVGKETELKPRGGREDAVMCKSRRFNEIGTPNKAAPKICVACIHLSSSFFPTQQGGEQEREKKEEKKRVPSFQPSIARERVYRRRRSLESDPLGGKGMHAPTFIYWRRVAHVGSGVKKYELGRRTSPSPTRERCASLSSS